VRALGSGGLVSRLQIVGDRFFLDERPPETGPYVQPDSSKIEIVTGSLASTDPPVRLLERAARQTYVDRLWIGTARALYWSDGSAIYSRSLPGVP